MDLRGEVRDLGLDDVADGQHADDVAVLNHGQVPDVLLDHGGRDLVEILIRDRDNEVLDHEIAYGSLLEAVPGRCDVGPHNIPLREDPDALSVFHHHDGAY